MSELFEDIKAMDQVSRSLAKRESSEPRDDVTAIEEGTRQYPNGTFETFRRVEFGPKN